MRIGIFDPYLDDLGGGEKYMMTVASCLSQNNDVTVFWNSKEDVDAVSKRFSLDLSKVNVSANIFSPHVSFIKRMMVSKNYDVIIYLSDGSVPTVLSKKLFLHIQQPLTNIHPNIKLRLKMKKVNKIFVNSFFTKDFVDKEFGTNSVVVYPPVEIHHKKIKKENFILHVGRFRIKGFTNFKKQDVLVEQFKKLEKDGLKNWKLLMAVSVNPGDEELFEEFRKSANGGNIEFLVNKTNTELWEIYSASKIYWHASGFGEDLDKNPEMAEHFGISTVEAMGSGCVPVVINAGGQKEIVEDNVTGFLWNTLEELREKTLLLTNEDKIRETMAEEGIKRAKDFSDKRFYEDIDNLVGR